MRTTRINWHRGRCPSRSDPRPVEAWRWPVTQPEPVDQWDESWDDFCGQQWDYDVYELEILTAFDGVFRNGVQLPPTVDWDVFPNRTRDDAAVPGVVEPGIECAWHLLIRRWSSREELREAALRLFEHPYFQAKTSQEWNWWDMTIVDFLARTERLWLRPLAAWEPPAGPWSEALLDLLRHLMVRFDVPACFKFGRASAPRPYTIEQSGALPDDEERKTLVGGWLCFIAAGRGWSLGKALRIAAKPVDLTLGESAVRFVWSAPANFDFPAVFCWLHLRVVGVDAELATRIVTTFGTEFVELIKSAAVFFLRHRTAVAQMERIAAWANHMAVESLRIEPRLFTLSGWSVRRVLEAAERFWRHYRAPHSSQAMAAREWGLRGWSWVDPVPGSDWQVLELNTSQQLEEESREQRHCVASYVGYCATGLTAIVSVRKGIKRVLTVEIQVASKAVVQVRGFANRPPTSPEVRLLERWADSFGLKIERI